jgi:hypothetical protein
MKESYLSAKDRGVGVKTTIGALIALGVIRATMAQDVASVLLSFVGPAFWIAVILLWRKYFAIRWRRLTWRSK